MLGPTYKFKCIQLKVMIFHNIIIYFIKVIPNFSYLSFEDNLNTYQYLYKFVNYFIS